MGGLTKIAVGVAEIVALGLLVLGMQRVRKDRRIAQLEWSLRSAETNDVFSEVLVEDLPAPARRYFLHAIQPGTPLARSVRLWISGRMKPREDGGLIDLTAEETLAPPRGFVWTARLKVGPLPLRVRDHYAEGDGAVAIHALGLVPVGRSTGPDVTRSSRHRLAGEAVWLPPALLPGSGAQWETVDATHARVTLTVDGEAIALTLSIDETGRLREVTMARYGDVGVASWELIPYGFTVEEEQTFGGYTIPSVLRGGWWYGTDRYDAAGSSRFRIQEASFY